MNILLYVSIAWVTLCVLFVGLDLILLLIVEDASNTSQAMEADEGISDQAPHIAKLDLAMDETVRRQAWELADTFGALAQLEDTVTLLPRDAIPTTHSAIAYRSRHMGAVIIRDPRLTRAWWGSDGVRPQTRHGWAATNLRWSRSRSRTGLPMTVISFEPGSPVRDHQIIYL
jgi:hypothetical protein